jgi:hypothetical protein
VQDGAGIVSAPRMGPMLHLSVNGVWLAATACERWQTTQGLNECTSLELLSNFQDRPTTSGLRLGLREHLLAR